MSQLARKHGDLTAFVTRRGGCCGAGSTGTDHHHVGTFATHSCRRVVWRRDRIDRRLEVQRRRAHSGMAHDSQPGLRRCEARSSERNAVDVGAAVAAVSGEAQRPAVLRVLPGAYDRHCYRIAVGVLDRLVVDHDAHARPTVANRSFTARVFCESVRQVACETTQMDSRAVRIALVTGAGSGIGRAVAIGLAADGFTVVLAGRRSDALEETATLVGGESLVQPTDVRDVGQRRCLVRRGRRAIRSAGSVVQQRRRRRAAGARSTS